MKTIKIQCGDVSLATDIYKSDQTEYVLLSLIGRTSNRKKSHYTQLYSRIAEELRITSIIFDYSGHGDTPGDLEELRPQQHFEEVLAVYRYIEDNYPNKKVVVVGSSYGGFMALLLSQQKQFDYLILRAPAIYFPHDIGVKFMNRDPETAELRSSSELLANHELLNSVEFKGRALVIAHENDEQIPTQTTDAFANSFNAEQLVMRDIPHSLDGVDQSKIDHYNQAMFNWLSKSTQNDS